MTSRNSMRYSVLKLEKLIKDHIDGKDDFTSKIELDEKLVDGEDVLNALNNIISEIRKEKENYERLERKYNKLEEEYENLKVRIFR